MRKIDAVLLSALIIYDYSAQSLADSETVNLGHSFTTEYQQEQTWMDSIALSSLDDNIVTQETTTYRNIKKLVPANTITYHELQQLSANALPEEEAEEITDFSITLPEASDELVVSILASDLEEIEAEEETPEELPSQNFTIATVAVAEKLIIVDPSQLDSDGDGVFDYEDKCLDIAGVARFEGCPIPDTDGDGVNDEEDRCPYIAGSIEYGGCMPEPETMPASTDNADTQDNSATLMDFSFENGVLSSSQFNKLLQLADEVIRDHNKKIEITQFGENRDTKKIISYLSDLGVKKTKITVLTKVYSADAGNDMIGLQLTE